jgi:hypothetical protein
MIVQNLIDSQIDFNGDILNYTSYSESLTVPSAANFPSTAPSRYVVELTNNIFVSGTYPITISGYTRKLTPSPGAGEFYILPYTTATDTSPLAYLVEFNSANAGASVTVNYYGIGSRLTKTSLNNQLKWAVGFTNQLKGLTISNNGTDANNDIDIAIGGCIDSTGVEIMQIGTSITKRLDASWVVGTNQGGLDTGSKANSTWYYIYVIKRIDTNVTDVLFSASATSPTMPANYSYYRKIGAIVTDGSGNIRGIYYHQKNEYKYKQPISDRAKSAPSNANRNLYTVTIPPNETGIFAVYFESGSDAFGWIDSANRTDAAASSTNHNLCMSNSTQYTGIREIQSNGSSQIAARFIGTGLNFALITEGYKLDL